MNCNVQIRTQIHNHTLNLIGQLISNEEMKIVKNVVNVLFMKYIYQQIDLYYLVGNSSFLFLLVLFIYYNSFKLHYFL